MKRSILFALAAASASVVLWSWRQPALDTLRDETVKARSQQAEFAALAKKLETQPVPPVDPQELNRLRALRPELARLRGGIAGLRRETNQTPDQLAAKTTTVQQEAALIRARREAKATSKQAASSIYNCLMLVTEAATLSDGSIPGNWQDVHRRILEGTSNQPKRHPYLTNLLFQAEGPGGCLANFEILPTNPNIRIQKHGEAPQVGLIREIKPRPQPDGGYARYYAWLDGRADEITMPNLDFSLWEAKNLNAGTAAATAR